MELSLSSFTDTVLTDFKLTSNSQSVARDGRQWRVRDEIPFNNIGSIMNIAK